MAVAASHVHVHVQEDATVSQRRAQMAWINRLDAAMADHRLLLARRPIVYCSSQGVPHWEILLRLRDEDGDLVTLGLLLPAAERFGMMPRLDRFVVEQITDFIAAEPRGEDGYAVNPSGASVGHIFSWPPISIGQIPIPSTPCGSSSTAEAASHRSTL